MTRLTILVAGASRSARKLLRRQLESEGYETHEAASGREALAQLAVLPIDLLLLDADLPKMDGFKTCGRLRSGKNGKESLPVVLLVKKDTCEVRAKGFESGVLDFLVKPVRKPDLLAVCAERLDSEKPVTGLTALVADESPAVRVMVAEILRRKGVAVVEADAGAKVKKILGARGKSADLVVSAVQLPGLRGEALGRTVLGKLGRRDVPVIFLCREDEGRLALAAYKLGGADCLRKPFLKEELSGRLDLHLAAREQRTFTKKLKSRLQKIEALIDNSLLEFERSEAPQSLSDLAQDSVRLAGEEREVTVLFADLEGFTSMAKTVKPGDLLELLNEYFEGMTEILERHGGTLDKYEGDALIGFWNAPREQADHARRAVSAALDMLKFTRELSGEFQRRERPALKTRIGIHTGIVIAGNVGARSRSAYTIVGKEVRVAYALEEANKKYGTCLLISDATYGRTGETFTARELEPVPVECKPEPVRVYEILG
ncbi:MAG: response regulator [Nitrospinae bacterium]|nr:response regulator [Nitrospinota bacterium]